MEYESKKGNGHDTDERVAVIEILLAKYFEGETTLDEERQLREFFSSGAAVPEHLKFAGGMFGYFACAAEETGLPARMPAGGATSTRKRKGVKLLFASLSAAAAVALAVLLINGPGGPGGLPAETTVYCYVDGVAVTDPELAMRYSEQALDLLSGTIGEPLGASVTALERLSEMDAVSKLGRFASMLEQIDINE